MRENVIKYVNDLEDIISNANSTIWEYAELAFDEYNSSNYYKNILKEHGFVIEENLAGMPTAFKATYGSGKPSIGILAEYDALPGLSQDSTMYEYSPLKENGNGHGCGHNSLGAASLGATLAIQSYLINEKVNGSIIFFGCPAEENGNGKTFMVRDGIFDDIDIALTWHPSDSNAIWGVRSLANVSVGFNFKGISSHAAAAPHLGRSALDAAEIMNIGTNYLREHIIQEARVHYAYLDVGGTAPNIVQNSAKLHYYIRAPKSHQVSEIYERIKKIAQGASLITETEVENVFYAGLSDFIPNPTISKLMYESFKEIGTPDYSPEDYNIASKYFGTLSESEQISITNKYNLTDTFIHEEISPFFLSDLAMPGSTDVGDVSYVVPTAQITVSTMALGTNLHSWQATAQSNSSIAIKGTKTAAKVIALTAIKIFEQPELVKQAKEELIAETKGEYSCPIPSNIKPNNK